MTRFFGVPLPAALLGLGLMFTSATGWGQQPAQGSSFDDADIELELLLEILTEVESDASTIRPPEPPWWPPMPPVPPYPPMPPKPIPDPDPDPYPECPDDGDDDDECPPPEDDEDECPDDIIAVTSGEFPGADIDALFFALIEVGLDPDEAEEFLFGDGG